jgi:hypothetical protein
VAARDLDLDSACCGNGIGGASWIFVPGPIEYLGRQEAGGIRRARRGA